MILASATTIHKTQGKSFDNLELDFQSTKPVPGLHYVGLTRCRTETGNCIVSSLHRNLISVNEKASREMCRMRSEAKFELSLVFPYAAEEADPSSIRIVCHNIQSLRKNGRFVKSSILYRNCTFVFLLETWLKPTDSDIEIESYNLHRFDWCNGSQRMHAGIAIYENINNIDTVYRETRISTTQFILVRSSDGKVNALVVHHRPQNDNENVRHFRQKLHELVVEERPDVVMGDMNVDDSQSNWLTALMRILGFEQRINSPTTDGFTTLDSVFVRESLDTVSHVLESPISYHKPTLTLL